MVTERDATPTPRGPIARLWPWLVLALAMIPAVWHSVDFPDDLDGEYPKVVRPTFSARPPSAYRLAEPGDTIDRVALYGSAAVVVFSAWGWIGARRAGLWPGALALGAALGWFTATPGPCYDGWHGLGWRAMADPSAPVALRGALAAAGLILFGVISLTALRLRGRWSEGWLAARQAGAACLLMASAVLVPLRAFDLPGIEPAGYWPRWCLAWGVMALALALVRLLPPLPRGAWRPLAGLTATAAGLGLIAGGLHLMWLHRPLERLRTVEPGKIYISAMPTYHGLEIEQRRLHFKTIINLFDETTHQRSPRLPEELRFAREHGIRFIQSPGAGEEADRFLDRTLAVAQDPSAWPILVHCHGCMDRSPAWMGIYRFVVQGRPLVEILREIEAHRGVRPKASVTLLYNHVLPARAPQRYAEDPTASLLRECARETLGPYERPRGQRPARPNSPAVVGVRGSVVGSGRK